MIVYPLVCCGRDYCCGIEEACKHGFHVTPYPGRYGIEEVGKGEKHQYQDLERVVACEMLQSTPLKDGGEEHLFAEADFVPQITAEKLKQVVARAPEDWEVLTFAWALKEQEEEEVKDVEEIIWSYRKRIVGSQALMFRDGKVVEKVRRLWERFTWGGIDMATGTSSLRQYAPSHYLIRQSHVNDFEEMPSPRDRRFLVCMNSYRRLKDAIRQIYTFMDQSYDNFIFQLLLHGVAEYDWKRCFEPNFSHFIREGRLVITFGGNGDQLSNVVRYGEGVNRDAYDLVVKVDDDDWYDRDYLKRLNYVHQSFPTEVGSWQDTVSGVYRQRMGYPTIGHEPLHFFGGNQIVIPKTVLDVVKEYEKSGRKPGILVPILGEEKGKEGWSWREDNLFVRLMVNMGMVDRTYLTPPPPGMLVTRVGASVTRGNKNFPFYGGSTYHILAEQSGVKVRLLIQDKWAYDMKSGVGKKWEIVGKDGEEIYVLRGDEGKMIILEPGKEGLWKMSEI